MRIFLGLNNNAGILSRLKKGFEEIGIKADFFSYKKHIFGYKSDKIISYSENSIIRKLQKVILLIKLIIIYNYFIFDSAASLLPGFKDIKILKFFGKKTMMIFTGCDARIPEAVEKFKWNPCVYCSDEYKVYTGCVIERKKSVLPIIEETFNIIVSPEEAGGFLKRDYYKTLFPVYLPDLPEPKPYTESDKIIILHAPSHEEYKGTKYIIESVNKLKKEFNIEFRIVKNVPINTIYKEIANCTILIDQMLIGFYGLISIEAMAMNKPVVCYIRDDIWVSIKNECPVFNSNPDNLYIELKKMINDMNYTRLHAIKGRDYIEKYHDAKIIAGEYLNLFKTA